MSYFDWGKPKLSLEQRILLAEYYFNERFGTKLFMGRFL
jgi:hypothetical protein